MIVARRFLAATIAASLGVVALPATSHAQNDSERAAAHAEADAGLDAFNSKDWGACRDHFRRAQAIVNAPPHLLYLARCSVQMGQLVSGREAYQKLVRADIAPTKPQAFRDAKANAENELAALESRVPYLNIALKGASGKTVTVKIDAAVVPPAIVGIPYPIDPGEHTLEISADGMTTVSKTVTVHEGDHQDVALELVPNVAGPPADVATSPTGSGSMPPAGVEPALPVADTAGRKGGSSLRTIGFVTAGVGVAALAVGGVFFFMSTSNTNTANSKYDQFQCRTYCPPDQQQQVKNLDSQAAGAKTIAVIAGGAGIVGLGVGLTLVFLPRRDGAPPRQGATVEPMIGPGSLGLRGAF
ncbi:MAG TPA: hypothetical protein VGL81_29270 [Polyangiaceae bacterium]|jgi:hypothetical protein|nr:hypothetical protein [Polyangiaceae bacterium]